jgi:hypothetical protein
MKFFLLALAVACQSAQPSNIVSQESDLKGCDEVHLFAPLRCLPGASFESCTEALLKDVQGLGATTLLINQAKENFVSEELLGRAFNCPAK